MFKIILSFLLCFAIIFFGIKAFRSLTDKQRWSLTKIAGYSILCAALTIAVLVGIVVLF